MCLGVPGKIVEVTGSRAVVDFWGVRRTVALDIVDEEVFVGDHVLVHVGFAIRRIAPEDLAETLAFFEAMASEDLEGLGPDVRRAPEASGEKVP
jgi:hydrogenase expression/formation protein HypC